MERHPNDQLQIIFDSLHEGTRLAAEQGRLEPQPVSFEEQSIRERAAAFRAEQKKRTPTLVK